MRENRTLRAGFNPKMANNLLKFRVIYLAQMVLKEGESCIFWENWKIKKYIHQQKQPERNKP